MVALNAFVLKKKTHLPAFNHDLAFIMKMFLCRLLFM